MFLFADDLVLTAPTGFDLQKQVFSLEYVPTEYWKII